MIKNRKQFSAWVIGLLALSLAGCSEAEVPSATTPGDDPLVNDPTRGYGIFAQTMLEQAHSVSGTDAAA